MSMTLHRIDSMIALYENYGVGGYADIIKGTALSVLRELRKAETEQPTGKTFAGSDSDDSICRHCGGLPNDHVCGVPADSTKDTK